MASSSQQEEDKQDVRIPVEDIMELARDMKKEMEEYCTKGLRSNAPQSTCCIHMVKDDYRSNKPSFISIGPYYADELFKDDYKYQCLSYLLSRTPDKGIGIEDYMKKLYPLEEQARACYSGKISLHYGHNFLRMMVLDASFILGLFYKFQNPGYELTSDDPLAPLKSRLLNLYEDLLRPANQIPFFVLQELFDISKKPGDPSLYLLALRFFNNVMRIRPKAVIKRYAKDFEKSYADPKKRPLHLLDLVRSSLIPSNLITPPPISYDCTCWDVVTFLLTLICITFRFPKFCVAWFCKNFWGDCFFDYDSDEEDKQVQFIPCISNLRRSGIRVRPDKAERLLAVKFENGVIKMPTITMNDFMMFLLRNCMAFEQFHENSRKYVTVYSTFLDCLVNTKEDVQYLRDCNIIDISPVDDDKVADFINSFCKGLNFDKRDFYLSELFNNVDNYYQNRFNVLRASFKHKYLNSPWSCISVLAGAVLLLLTITQTVFTILAYVHPKY